MRPMILGQFSPPALACVRSWGEQGWRPGLICIRKTNGPLPASRRLGAAYSLHPDLLYREEGLDAVRGCLESFRADGLLCIQESLGVWLDQHREALDGFDLWVPPAAAVKRVLSKRAQIEAARRVGLSVLPTWLLDTHTLGVLEDVPDDLFPLCLRPSGEGGVAPGFKVRSVRNREEARSFVLGLRRIDAPLIAQPFRNLPNLVVHGARSAQDRSFGLQGFLVARKFEGLTLTIRPVELQKDLVRRCIDFTRELGVVGSYHFEFLYDPRTEEAHFLEVNARLGGTTAKVFACGYDEPVLALQAFGAGGERKKRRAVRNVTASSRLALGKYVVQALTRRITPLDYPQEPDWARVAKALWGMARYRDDVISSMDVKGTLSFYRQVLADKYNAGKANGSS
jgi:hypothetical protein